MWEESGFDSHQGQGIFSTLRYSSRLWGPPYSFLGGKAADMKLAIHLQVELQLQFSIRLHDAVLNQLSTGTDLHLPR
jgi:hypothetical protein